jgi:3-oxoacyl-[acyl-carrier protein] reductase
MIDPASLAGKAALVIGGSGGIGAATADLFARAGARVAITHRPGTDKETVARAIIAKLPGKGHAGFPADVADTASLIALRAAIETNFSRLDILVNTSGFTKPVPHGDLDALED